ncbi:MAG TPA: hypothetical protein VGY58_16745 [Gemmataceae bacterium]|jgi:hypothetical protein|nr:hypothetical protein [Gemmataceae bacterium]
MDQNQADFVPSPAASSSVPRFDTAPYQPDGACPLSGMLVAAAASLLAAVVCAWLVSFVSQWIYLIFFFPLALGLGIGLGGNFGVHRGKVRNGLCAGLIGFAAGCLGMVAVHYFDYQRDLRELEKEHPGMAQLWQGMGVNFFTYIDSTAEDGVRIGKVGHGNDKGMNLGYVGSYIYWALEVLGVGIIGFAMMRHSARAPFCSACNTWKAERKLGQVVMPAREVEQAIVSGEIVRLADADFGDVKGQLVIKAAVCPNCGSEAPVDVRLEQITVNAKGEQKAAELAHVTYPGQALAVLESLAQPSPSPAPPTPGSEATAGQA